MQELLLHLAGGFVGALHPDKLIRLGAAFQRDRTDRRFFEGINDPFLGESKCIGPEQEMDAGSKRVAEKNMMRIDVPLFFGINT